MLTLFLSIFNKHRIPKQATWRNHTTTTHSPLRVSSSHLAEAEAEAEALVSLLLRLIVNVSEVSVRAMTHVAVCFLALALAENNNFNIDNIMYREFIITILLKRHNLITCMAGMVGRWSGWGCI